MTPYAVVRARYPAGTGCACTTCERTSKGARFGSTQYRPCARAAAAGESTTWLKLRRSALNRPATNRPNANAADSSGVEKVEKNSAIAVTTESSTNVSQTALSMAGSAAGASQPSLADGSAHDMRASTTYRAAVMIARLTA